jgi:glycosyltransferase involved in cell wall biosynthesis
MTAHRVGVNLLWLVPGVVGGSEEYTTRLLRAVAERPDPDVVITLFTNARFAAAHADLVAAFPTVSAPVDGASKPRRVAAETTWLPRQARQRRIELMHHAGGTIAPGPANAGLAAALTIHDLQPLVLPDNFGAVKRRWLGAMLPRSARQARVVLTPSDPVSASVTERLGVPAAQVLTVPHGVEPPAPVGPERLASVSSRYRLGQRVVLYPAITYGHKDHVTLIRAFARVARSRPDVTLVLTGGAGPAEQPVIEAIRDSGVGEQIRRTGRIPWDDLHGLYGLATVVAVPSRFEGFGAPALEAMAAGVPVLAADATALPWVVGEAGVLAPPGDEEAWADALTSLLDDPAERRRRSAAGRARAATFGWDRAGRALLAGYHRALGADEDGGS